MNTVTIADLETLEPPPGVVEDEHGSRHWWFASLFGPRERLSLPDLLGTSLPAVEKFWFIYAPRWGDWLWYAQATCRVLRHLHWNSDPVWWEPDITPKTAIAVIRGVACGTTTSQEAASLKLRAYARAREISIQAGGGSEYDDGTRYRTYLRMYGHDAVAEAADIAAFNLDHEAVSQAFSGLLFDTAHALRENFVGVIDVVKSFEENNLD